MSDGAYVPAGHGGGQDGNSGQAGQSDVAKSDTRKGDSDNGKVARDKGSDKSSVGKKSGVDK